MQKKLLIVPLLAVGAMLYFSEHTERRNSYSIAAPESMAGITSIDCAASYTSPIIDNTLDCTLVKYGDTRHFKYAAPLEMNVALNEAKISRVGNDLRVESYSGDVHQMLVLAAKF